MGIAVRTYTLCIVTVLLLGCLLAGYLAQREYSSNYRNIVDDAQRAVSDRPDLQFALYERNEARLSKYLAGLLEGEAVATTAFYDNQGKRLARSDADPIASLTNLSMAVARGSASASDTVIVAFSPLGEETGDGFWSSLFGSGSTINITMPIFSPVNPTRKGLTLSDFAEGAAEQRNNSLVVMGYGQVVIDAPSLAGRALSSVRGALLVYLAIVVLCGGALYRVLRNVTVPVSQLTDLARKVLSGEHKEPLEVDKRGQFSDILEVFNRQIEGTQNYQTEIEVDRKLLTMRVDESASKLTQRDEELNKAAAQISVAKDHLHKLAYYDELTSLPNRALFTEQLRLLLPMSQRDGKPVALLYLNLNQFKRINDSLGRRAGDFLLVEVSKRLTSCLRSSDMLGHYSGSGPRIDVSRLGSDEFSIVLNQLDNAKSAGLVAQRLIESLVEPVVVEGHELVVSPSIGIAIAEPDSTDVEDLLRAAATAMHQAKSAPKGSFVFYQPEMDAGGLDHIKLEGELRKAIERDQLLLHYQPQVDTTDGSIRGVEALLRWEHPEYGQVPPFRFIPIAEDIGLMDELGNWVLDEVCRQLKAFAAEGLELPRVAINVSRLQFGDSFTDRLKQVLAEADLSASVIELGLSEEILMDNDSDTIKALRELSEMGVYLSIDNFGTTAAPLSYIGQYPLNELKVDRSFVADCDKLAANANLVKAILAMAKSLNLSVVAEGVETQEEYQFLSDNGARAMQGYLFSKPVPAQELRQQLVVPWHYMTQLQRMALMQQQPTADRN